MAKTVQQTVLFDATPARLFDLYMDAKKHAAATGAPAVVARRVGGAFSVHNGQLVGRTLHLVPNRLVVQSWRSVHWPKDDLDSILTLIFSRYDDRGRVTLVHANVPDADYAGVKNGWNQYYWRRWKAYLSANRGS
jgi:activator of HSP90 ATPase